MISQKGMGHAPPVRSLAGRVACAAIDASAYLSTGYGDHNLTSPRNPMQLVVKSKAYSFATIATTADQDHQTGIAYIVRQFSLLLFR